MISGGLQINAPQPYQARFLVDTGTNQVLLVPTRHYQMFIRSLIPDQLFDSMCGHDPQAGVVCDCSIQQYQELNPLRIVISGQGFELPLSKMFMTAPGKHELCLLTIQPNDLQSGSSMPGLGGLLGGLLGSLFGPSMSNKVLPQQSGVVTPSDTSLRAMMGRRLQNLGYPTPATDPNEYWMIGGFFLEHFVTIFDFDNGRLGFANPASGLIGLNAAAAGDTSSGVLPSRAPAAMPFWHGRKRFGDVAMFAVVGTALTALLAATFGAWRFRAMWTRSVGSSVDFSVADDEQLQALKHPGATSSVEA